MSFKRWQKLIATSTRNTVPPDRIFELPSMAAFTPVSVDTLRSVAGIRASLDDPDSNGFCVHWTLPGIQTEIRALHPYELHSEAPVLRGIGSGRHRISTG